MTLLQELTVKWTVESKMIKRDDDLPEDPDQSPRDASSVKRLGDPEAQEGKIRVGMRVIANGEPGVVKRFGGDAVFVLLDGETTPDEFDITEVKPE